MKIFVLALMLACDGQMSDAATPACDDYHPLNEWCTAGGSPQQLPCPDPPPFEEFNFISRECETDGILVYKVEQFDQYDTPHFVYQAGELVNVRYASDVPYRNGPDGEACPSRLDFGPPAPGECYLGYEPL